MSQSCLTSCNKAFLWHNVKITILSHGNLLCLKEKIVNSVLSCQIKAKFITARTFDNVRPSYAVLRGQNLLLAIKYVNCG